jgi:hypothetical protein
VHRSGASRAGGGVTVRAGARDRATREAVLDEVRRICQDAE